MKVVIPDMVSVSIWRHGYFEEDVCTFLLHLLRPGDNFVDIGGHFGFFSMLARELVGKHGTVITFEPMPGTREILRENMEINAAMARHHLVPTAAGARAGHLQFKDFGLVGSAFATSTQVRNSGLKLKQEIDVEVKTLDSVVTDIGLSSLRFIKIDAENAEFEVVQGGIETLRKMRPAVVLETGDTQKGATRRVVDLIASLGYAPFEFRNWQIKSHELAHSYGFQNLLFLPDEHVGSMLSRSDSD